MHIGNEGGGPSRSSRGKKRGRRSHGGNEEVALQITSMADIFTIILVFLLKSYSVSATNVNVGKDVKLPVARGGMDHVEAMKIEVTATGVNVETQPVVQLTNYEAAAKDIRDGTLPALVKAFKVERDKQRQLASAQGEDPAAAAKKDGKLLVIADKGVPYKLLKLVLASASVQDYTDFKLVVVQED